MEFPHIGQNCSVNFCGRLDFLPVKCDSCNLTFCSEHFTYEKHQCAVAQQKDVQVPVCPLCGEPVPTPRNTSPDITVGQHIDESCRIKKTKIFTNNCSVNKCKKKELIPFTCSDCKQNFCLSHRHMVDHKCAGPAKAKQLQRNFTAQAATSRQSSIFNFFNQQPTVSSSNHLQSVQGNMTEDEALAHALALSLEEESNNRSNQNQQSVPCGNGTKDKCTLC